MIREHLNRALVVAAGLCLAAAAAAQTPATAKKDPAAATTTKVDDKAKPDNKADQKDQKADDNKGKTDPSASATAAKDADHGAIVKAQHEAERAKIVAVLRGPMPEAMKQELQRHARREARLERIKALATEAKDTDAVARATKLIDKENARHDKWIADSGKTAAANPNPDTK